MSVLVEICADSESSSVVAAAAGAGRIELCAHAVIGGVTPSAALLQAVRERVPVPVFAMVRARGGDFVYGAEELGIMRRDASRLREAGASGIVSGVLCQDGSIDEEATRTLIEAARPLPFTFHRAFDLVPDKERALDVLLALGVERVLTSGGSSTAQAGADRIAALVRQAGDRLTVMAGGGVRGPHVAELVRRTGVREVHARPIIRQRDEIDPAGVRALVAALR